MKGFTQFLQIYIYMCIYDTACDRDSQQTCQQI